MTADELTNRLHRFESTISAKDWEVWEAIRFHLYFQILNISKNIDQKPAVPTHSNVKRKKILEKLREVMQFLKFCLKNKGKSIIFAHSRFLNDNRQYYDPNIVDFYNLIKQQAFIIETTGFDKFQYPVIQNPILGTYYRIYSHLHSHQVPTHLKDTIVQAFGVTPNWGAIDSVLSQYFADKAFYRSFLKFVKPESIFITQAGIQKGLFRSAKALNVPVTEFQHGILYFSNVNYTYSPNIESTRLAIPDYFITFSDFWTKKIKDYFPVKQILACGNTTASSIKPHDEIYDLTFICCTFFMKRFIEIVDQLTQKGYNGKICLKLHPQQSAELDEIKAIFQNNDKVSIVFTEESIKDTIGKSKALLTMQSTSVYEALDAGKPMIILKEQLYEVHNDIFDDPNVVLVENADEILTALSELGEKRSVAETHQYFKPFNKHMAVAFLNNQLNMNI